MKPPTNPPKPETMPEPMPESNSDWRTFLLDIKNAAIRVTREELRILLDERKALIAEMKRFKKRK
jgi:hypothetical protein